MNESIGQTGTPGIVTKGPVTSVPATSAVGWRGSRWLAGCELAAVALIFAADWGHLIPFSKTPFLLLLGWISLRLRKIGWRDIGLARHRGWAVTLSLGLTGGVLIEAFELFASQPLLVWLTGKQPNLEDFRILTGNLKVTLVVLALAWTLAAFGEEMVYRGYLMNRVADLGRRTRRAWVGSLVLVSIMFALAHTYQGVTGVVEAGLDGALLALLYLGTGRNLSAPIIAHGFTDTVDVLLIYLGRYPGM